MDKQLLAKVLGGTAVTYGVLAVASPDLLLKTYRLDITPEARGLVRVWGTRTTLLGTLILRARDRRLDDLLISNAVLNGVDAVLEVGNRQLDGATGPGGALAGASSATMAALSLLALRSR